MDNRRIIDQLKKALYVIRANHQHRALRAGAEGSYSGSGSCALNEKTMDELQRMIAELSVEPRIEVKVVCNVNGARSEILNVQNWIDQNMKLRTEIPR